MEIVYDDDELKRFISKAVEINPDHPVLIDRFLDNAIEVDVDALYDGKELYLAGVMEHIEEAGIHSGDSACVIPPQQISSSQIDEIFSVTERLARAIEVRGLINVQYAIYNNKLFVLEANPRASRTVPFVSKATGVLLAKSAALISIGKNISDLRNEGILPEGKIGRSYGISVKEAVLPWNRFRRRDGRNVDSVLGPEMKSTGEVMGIANDFGSAFAKSQISAFGALPTGGKIFVSLADKDKQPALDALRALYQLGFEIFSTRGTSEFLERNSIRSSIVGKHFENRVGEIDAVELIGNHEIKLVVNTPFGRDTRQDGWLIRSTAVVKGIPCITTVPALRAAVSGIRALQGNHVKVKSLQDWFRN
jgi:carbamoyl-phosphate synthase large subunit